MSNPKPPPVQRPSVLSLNINSKSALYAAFMPHLKHGGIFIPTTRSYNIGDEVFIFSIGVHFNNDESGQEARRRIEGLLGGIMQSTRPTHTL